jgi:phosphopantetheinyl transferase (holo-ACP synthase)
MDRYRLGAGSFALKKRLIKVLGRIFNCRASWRTVEILGEVSKSSSKNLQQSLDTSGRSMLI